MRMLLLSRLKTIEVTEKSIGFKNPVLFHFIRRELAQVVESLEAAHLRLLYGTYRILP
jgi:hypothetical protein